VAAFFKVGHQAGDFCREDAPRALGVPWKRLLLKFLRSFLVALSSTEYQGFPSPTRITTP
jgi:hypothetical protein